MLPLSNNPKETKLFPGLTGGWYQIKAFPCAIGEHSDLFRARRTNDERHERQPGKVLALKILRASSRSNASFEADVQAKLVKLRNQWALATHPNIAKIYGVGRLPAIIAMGYYSRGSIASRTKAQTTTDEEKLQWVNIVGANKERVLEDVGMVYMTDMPEFTMMKTATTGRFAAPELMDPNIPRPTVEGPECTTQSDVFPFEMTAIEIFSGDVPFSHKKNVTNRWPQLSYPNTLVKADKDCVLTDVMKSAATCCGTAPDLLSSRRGRSHAEGSTTPPTPEGDASAEGVQVPPPCSPSADAAGQSGGSHEQWTETESDTAGEGTKTRDENGKLEIVGYAEEVWVETIDTINAGRDVTVHKTCNYYYPQLEADRILADRTSQLEASLSSLMKDFSSMSQDLASGANVSSDLRQLIESIDLRLKRLEQLITDSAGSPNINAGPLGISISPPPGSVAPISPQPMVTLPPVASTPTPSAACPTFTWVPVPIAFFQAPPMAGPIAPTPMGMPVVPPSLHWAYANTTQGPQTPITTNSSLATSQ